MRTMLVAVVAVLTAVPAQSAEKKPPIEGFWDTPGGRLYLARSGKTVTGTLAGPAEGVTIKKGQKAVKGSFEDDNLSAEVPLELVAPMCHTAGSSAYLMMLLTKSGKLTGGVSATDPCAADLSTVRFVRSEDQKTGAPVKPKKPMPTLDAAYNAHGKRTQEMQASVKPLMKDGQAYMNEGQFEKARDLFRKALEADSSVGEAYNGVGVTYYARNDYEAAISWYKQGLEAAPGFGDLYYNMACAYSQQGNKDIALRYLRLAVAKGYTDVDNIDSDPDLEPLRSDPVYIELRRGLGPATAVPAKSP